MQANNDCTMMSDVLDHQTGALRAQREACRLCGGFLEYIYKFSQNGKRKERKDNVCFKGS
jgi:hypothetical protein